MKFTVVLPPSVDDALADLWLNAPEPQMVTDAANWIERELANDPLSKLTQVDDAYFLRRDPLCSCARLARKIALCRSLTCSE